MRIAIDGFNFALARGTGIATYGVELASALREMGHEVEGVFGLPVPKDPALRESAFFDRLKRPPDATRKSNRYQRAWYFLRSFRRARAFEISLSNNVEKAAFADALPRFDRLSSAAHLFENAFTSFKVTDRFVRVRVARPPDVMHWTYPVPIEMVGSRNIYTLHDLVPLKLPYTTLDDKVLYGRIVARCIKNAAQICTVSEASKRDITDRYRVDPARITNTYQTVFAAAHASGGDPAADARAIEGIFGLSHRGYFLYYGAIEPKKNVGLLIEAYLALQTTTPLVIVGARAWQADQELRLMPGGGANGAPGTYQGYRGQTIMRLDYMSRDLLKKLIRGAKAVVFPSLYEGFGLPTLEGMQLGTPVITSNTSSLPEVAGDAGLLINPYDVGQLQEAMHRVDSDDALCRMMAARGIEQARLFSRDRYRERLAELYQAALAPR